jgi:putative pyruvate formate lyase activating enzyme
MKSFAPAYKKLLRSGELTQRARIARQHQKSCDLCARYCRVDRSETLGACRIAQTARIASYGPHHGEEGPLRGWRGSGTIFFSSCNLHCQYCQNSDISQNINGPKVGPDDMADIMLRMQSAGCHNINLVSPSHVVAEILEGLVLAAENGLHLPLVFNTGGYDSMEALALLDGVIDIYMPDMKYSDPAIGLRLSKVRNYPQVNREAVREMHRQVGDLVMDNNGIAQRGLLVRHLVLPGGLAGTAGAVEFLAQEISPHAVEFLAQEISPHTYLNLMDQYYPAYRANEYPPLDRRLTRREFEEALALAHAAGLSRLD